MIGPNVPQRCWVTDIHTPQCLSCNWSELVNNYTTHIPNSQHLLEFQHDPAAEYLICTSTRITGLVLFLSLFPALLLVSLTKFKITTISLIWDHLLGSSMQAVANYVVLCAFQDIQHEKRQKETWGRNRASPSSMTSTQYHAWLASEHAMEACQWQQTLYNCLLIPLHFYNACQPRSFSEPFSLYIWLSGFHAHRLSQTQTRTTGKFSSRTNHADLTLTTTIYKPCMSY